MARTSPLTNLLLISGAPALMLLAFIFDAILRMLAPSVESSLDATATFVFMAPLFDLLLLIAVVSVIWMVLSAGRFSRLVSLAYLAPGLLMLYSSALLFVLPLPDSWYILTIYLAPNTLAFHTAGALAAIGLVTLWFWKAPEAAAEPAPLSIQEMGDESADVE